MHTALARLTSRQRIDRHRTRLLAPAILAAATIGATTAAAAPLPVQQQVTAGVQAPRVMTSMSHRMTTARAAAFGAALPLSFEVNRGQVGHEAQYLARGHGYAVALSTAGAILTLSAPAAHPGTASPAHTRPTNVHITLLGGNRAAHVQGQGTLPGTVSYLAVRDRARPLTHIPTYAAVEYSQVYRGVDLVYYGRQGRLEYDFRVAPGADPGQIKLSFQGAARPSVAANGDLVLRAGAGVLHQHRPVIYQLFHGARRQIAGGYALAGQTVGLRVGAYDRREPLVIDPVLTYATYYGGGGADYGNGIAVDGQGDVYVVGTTTSGFPVQTAFVSKFDPTGAHVLWTQYINNQIVAGDPNSLACDANGTGIGLDRQGNVYITGMYKDKGTFSWDSNLCDTRAVLWAKIDPADSAPLVAHFGTCSDSRGISDNCYNSIAVDGDGNAYITGATEGTEQNFPVTQGAFQTTPGIDKSPNGLAGDAFVLKIDSAGSEVYGTFLGGSYLDAGLGIAVDGQGNAFVVGKAGSSNFPITSNGLQTQMGNGVSTGFVSELSADGSQLLYSTFLGGNNGEAVNGVAVDGQGYVYVVGETNSDNFPVTANAYDRACGTDDMCNATKTWYCDGTTCYWQIQAPEDVFVSKLDPRQSGDASLVYSTFLGGMNRDLGQAIAVDQSGHAFVTGRTASIGDFPILNASQPAIGGDYDGFVAELDTMQSGAGSLVYSTFLGGAGYDEGDAIAVDGSGNAYVTGYTASTNFPTLNAPQGTNNGGSSDAFLARLSPAAPVSLSAITWSQSGGAAGSATGTVTLSGPAPAGGAVVNLASSAPSTASVPANVSIAAGATSANFTISLGSVAAPTQVTISASYNGVTVHTVLSVAPPPRPTATNTTSPPSPTSTTPPPSPTNTPTHTATTAPSATATPTATATRQSDAVTAPSTNGSATAVASPGSKQPVPVPSGSGTHHSGGTPHVTALLLALGRVPASVAAGGSLPLTVKTAPGARLSAVLSVTARHVGYQGSGKHRKRVMQTIVLYRVTQQGSADRRGRWAIRLRITTRLHTPVNAALIVRSQLGRATRTESTAVTIQRPARPTAHHRPSHGHTARHR